MKKIIAIIQARMASSRLPDKVLLDIAGRPMLAWVVERTQRANWIDDVIVATTTDASDDPVADFCARQGYAVTRGSAHDVLDRYYQAARPYSPDAIVRITADCPLLDPALVDETIAALLGNDDEQGPIFDFTTNRLPLPWGRTYPIGLDVEAFTFDALERAWHETSEQHQREHVTPYFYEDIPAEVLQFSGTPLKKTNSLSSHGFRAALLHYKQDYGHLRWTVDTPEDLNFVCEVVSRLGNLENFTWLDVLALVQREPELMQINAAVEHKTHLDVDQRAR